MRGAAGYARIFGRVATLAVAFGIGVTVATMPGAAWADESGSGAPSSPDAVADEPSQDAAPSPESEGTSITHAAKDSSAGTSATVAVGDSPEVTYGVSGGASIPPADDAAADETADETAPASPNIGPAPEVKAPPAALAATSSTTSGPSLAGSEPHAGAASRGEGAVPVHLRLSAPRFDGRPDGVDAGLRPVTSTPAPIRDHVDPISESTIRAAAGPSTVGETTDPTALPGNLLSVASGLLVAILAPFVVPTPATPADTPVLWAVLGWARRQLGDEQPKLGGTAPKAGDDLDDLKLTLTAPDGNQTSAHTVGSTSTVDQETGWVTGWVFAQDPDDDRVSYSGSGPTGKGDVIVYEDASFLYKPSAEARQLAAVIGGDQDTFTIRVSDGRGNDRSIPVTVDVLPAA